MNTESKIWTALSAMGNEANTSVRDLMVGDALNELAEMQAEIARLRAALHNQEREFLNAESERTTLRDAVNVYQSDILALRAALKPFADLSGIYVRRAEAFGWKDADGVFGAADVEMERNITVGDCRAALKALGEEG